MTLQTRLPMTEGVRPCDVWPFTGQCRDCPKPATAVLHDGTEGSWIACCERCASRREKQDWVRV